MQRITIPKRDNSQANLNYPITVRLTLQQRRIADLLAAQANYSTTSEFIRDLLSNASREMFMGDRQAA